MLTDTTFIKQFLLLSENFSFNFSVEYQTLIFNALRDKISDKEMIEITTEIINTTTLKSWNESYGFKGKPAVADWLGAYVPKPIYVEKTFYKICPITGANLAERRMVLVENLKGINER